MRTWLLAIGVGAAIAAYFLTRPRPERAPASPEPTIHGYEIVREYPHDPEAFTQGLIYRDGFLYESTGLNGRSSLRKVRLETGEVLQQHDLDARYFGEGLTEWGGLLLQLTPMRAAVSVPSALGQAGGFTSVLTALGRRFGVNVGSSYDMTSLEPQSTFSYKSEGWGLTHDDRRLILSDGTASLRFLDPDKFYELGDIEVAEGAKPIGYLNELEFVGGAIYANVWHEDRIAIISPDSGAVTGWIDLTGLGSRMMPPPDRAAGAVLNGIAYDAVGDRLFVTGKLWPRLFEIRLRPVSRRPS